MTSEMRESVVFLVDGREFWGFLALWIAMVFFFFITGCIWFIDLIL
jgi:hypothetical protein